MDKVVEGVRALSYPVLNALFPRSYIDVNRSDKHIDKRLVKDLDAQEDYKKVNEAYGTGLVRRFCSYSAQVPIYKQRLRFRDVFNRIANYYKPYHAKLSQMIDKTHAEYGQAVYISCHSLPSEFRTGEDNPYDIYLGTGDDQNCDPRLTQAMAELFRQKGYRVAVNHFFKGGHNIRKYGIPKDGRHAMLVEVNRGLYAKESAFALHENFDAFQKDFTDIMVAFDKISRNLLMPPGPTKGPRSKP